MRTVVLSCLLLAVPGTATAQLGYGAGAAAALSDQPRQRSLEGAWYSTTLLLFGGENNRDFLGCLNCTAATRESVHNDVGPYGSTVSSSSIRNPVSRYGSAVSTYSSCNEIASHPPIIVDTQGHFYGELTINVVRPRRATGHPQLSAWLKRICST